MLFVLISLLYIEILTTGCPDSIINKAVIVNARAVLDASIVERYKLT